MFVMEMNGVMLLFESVFSKVIIRGPLSFGFFSSINAGKNIRRISMGVVVIIMIISFRFGIIGALLSSIV